MNSRAVADEAPLVVGIGGTTRPDSSSERSLRLALDRVQALGCRTRLFAGGDLVLPLYEPGAHERAAEPFLSAIRQADALVIASPCYHGAVSGLVKNALDYLEETAGDSSPYLHARAVGLIACGYGGQGPAMVLAQLRNIVHALRGWPTPLGIALNSATVRFSDGSCSDQHTTAQIELMAAQLADFAGAGRRHRAAVKGAA